MTASDEATIDEHSGEDTESSRYQHHIDDPLSQVATTDYDRNKIVFVKIPASMLE